MSQTSVDRPSVVVPGQQLAADADDREAAVTQSASASVATESRRDEQAGRSVRTRVPKPRRAARPAAQQPKRRGAGSGAPGTLGVPPMIPLGAPVAGGMPLASGPDPAAWVGSVPYAAPSLQALKEISDQFGTGTAVG